MQSIFDDNEIIKIKNIINGNTKDHEFEIIFGKNKINYSEFLDLLKYIGFKSKLENISIETHISLDMIYNYDKVNRTSYRLSVKGLDKINEMMSVIHNRKNHVIFSILVTEMMNSTDNSISVIRKHRDINNSFENSEFNVKIKNSKEEVVKDKKVLTSLLQISEKDRFNIIFRLKNRRSIILINNENCIVRMDITSVKSNININKIESTETNYEMELELIKKSDKTKNIDKCIDTLIKETTILEKIIQKSNYLIKQSEKQDILNKYFKLIGREINNLYTMNPQSIEIQHVVDKIPVKYNVTDKADGDRYNLFIFNNKVYMCSTNFDLKYTGIEIKKKEYNNTIIDGEYIYISNKRKYVFLAFDILFHKGEDIREISLLSKRLEKLDDVLDNVLNNKFKFQEYKDKYDIDKIQEFHRKEINKWIDDLNNRLNDKNNLDIIKRKYFIFTFGGHGSEIFNYSRVIWESNFPYSLDGLMYTGDDQIYTKTQKDIKYNTYKWKPPSKNSIDFYIRFEKSSSTGQILKVFDDSIDRDYNELGEHDKSDIRGKIYQICNLYVGKMIGNIEKPVLFQKEKENYIVHLYLQNGAVRDIHGNIIEDNTVVEFYYEDDETIPEKERWIPLRTRFDKTENVIKYKKKYGNYIDVAEKTWRSIKNKITMDDIIKLSDKNTYENFINVLRNRIDVSLIEKERVQDIYYQKITRIGHPMKQFHNWIKSNMIYLYCSQKFIKKNNEFKKVKLSALEVGIGRGGDIMKYFHTRTKFLVGLDVDEYGIFAATDGAISRYKNHKEKFPSFPKMDFLVADAGIPLDYNNQNNKQSRMSDINKKQLIKYFGRNQQDKIFTKFDVLNCQFMIHYLLQDDNTWNNFCYNIDKYLNNDGYLLITTFDAELVNKSFNKEGKISSYYTENDGNKELLFEIIKRYDDKNLNQLGLRIDVFMSFFMEKDTYRPEYLVSKDFLIKELKEKANMELIETDNFKNIFETHKYFFDNAASSESNKHTKNWFMQVKEYYETNTTNSEHNSVVKAAYINTFLNRYYIFRKIGKDVQKGGYLQQNYINL